MQIKTQIVVIKNFWTKGVKAWNDTVILLFLTLIYFCVLTPIALIYQMLGKSLSKQSKNQKSFLKKPDPFLKHPEKYFKAPF